MQISVGSFLRKEMFHPCDAAVPNNRRCSLLIVSIVSGILTAGLLHLFCYIFLYNRTVKIKQSIGETKVKDVAVAAMLPGPIPIEKLTVNLPHTEMPKKDENNQGSSKKDPDGSNSKDSDPKTHGTVVSTSVTSFLKDENTTSVLRMAPKPDPTPEQMADSKVSQITPLPTLVDKTNAVAAPEPVENLANLSDEQILNFDFTKVAKPEVVYNTLYNEQNYFRLMPKLSLYALGQIVLFLSKEHVRFIKGELILEFDLFQIKDLEQRKKAINTLYNDYHVNLMNKWSLEMIYHHMAIFSDDHWKNGVNQALAKDFDFTKLSNPEERKRCFERLFGSKTDIGRVQRIGELSKEKVDELWSLFESVHWESITNDDIAIGFDFNKISDLTKRQQAFNSLFKTNSYINNRVPKLSLSRLYELAPLFSDKHWEALSAKQREEFDFNKISDPEMRQKVFNILLNPERYIGTTQIQKLSLSKIYELSSLFSDKHWEALSIKQREEFDYNKISNQEMRQKVFNIFLNPEEFIAKTQIQQFSLSKIYELSSLFSDKHWALLSDEQSITFDFSKIADTKLRAKLFAILFNLRPIASTSFGPISYASIRIPKLSMEQLYRVMPLFSSGHWKAVSTNQALAFDFTKIVEPTDDVKRTDTSDELRMVTRQEVFNLIFFVDGEPNTGNRLTSFKLEKIYNIMQYFSPGHWKAISSTYADKFDFTKITDVAKRKEVFNHLFSLDESNDRPLACLLHRLPLLQIYELSQYFSEGHWQYVSFANQIQYDMAKIPIDQRKTVINCWFNLKAVNYKVTAENLNCVVNEQIVKFAPYFSLDHWNYTSKFSRYSLITKVNKEDRQTVFNRWFSLDGDEESLKQLVLLSDEQALDLRDLLTPEHRKHLRLSTVAALESADKMIATS